MKTNLIRIQMCKFQRAISAVLLVLSLLLARSNLTAQPVPHHFRSITVLPDQTITLSLDGSVSNLFNLAGAGL